MDITGGAPNGNPGGLSNIFTSIQNVARAIGQLNQTLGNLLITTANTWSALQTFTAGITVSGGALTATPSNANVVLSPTGTGVVTINPATAGSINNITIGGITPLAGTFTTVTANTSVTTSNVATSANLVLGNGGAIPLTATTGWVEIPSCAGTPTGVPANAGAGKIAIVFDSTGKKLWVYDAIGGSWKGVVVA